MSTTKSAGASKLGRDSQPKYLGVKLYAGQKVKAGGIIIRQRGAKFIAGENVRKGTDDTLYAVREGVVFYKTNRKKNFDGSKRLVKIVNVV